jgi:hypothetical protein
MGRIPRWLRLATKAAQPSESRDATFQGNLKSLSGLARVTAQADGDHVDRILGCGPAGLQQSRGPLGKCSSCDGNGEARPPSRAARDTSHSLHVVSSLRLMAIIWTAPSDAARQACGEAAARWGNAQAAR